MIAGPIAEDDTVTLVGNTHPLARPEFDKGAIAPETSLTRMVLVFQPSTEQQGELDALVEAQHTPGSPLYHHWLTPEEYGERFGADASDIARIASWLESHGFTVEPVAAGRRTIVFSGHAGQVADTFRTEIHRYGVNGTVHIANALDPEIPRAMAPVVGGILSLNDFRSMPQMIAVRRLAPETMAQASPEYTSGSTHYIAPGDYGVLYDLNPLYQAGTTGSGVSIAIVGRSDINLNDVASFRSNFGLPENQPTVIHDGADPGINDSEGDQDESTLDVEWSGAVGYGATVDFVVAESTETTDGVDLAAQYIVDHDLAQVMSTSYGACEAEEGSAEMAFFNNLWEQAASEGISSIVSAGDSGAAGCDWGSSTRGSVQGVNGLCSSPYSTCVGGTEFNEGSGGYWNSGNSGSNGSSALSYIPEKVWNESGSSGGSGLWAGGGGVSQVYTQPSWQAGITGGQANGMRTVPDVSLTASSHDGYLIWENGSMEVMAGTSAASPSFAGIMSLVVQKQGGAGQGNANPALYELVGAEVYPFHPTLSGNNSVPGVTGYTATGSAYNLATGLGSVDGDILVNQWPSSSIPVPVKGVALNPGATSVTLFPGASTTFTLAVVGTGGYSGTVALTATAPTGITVRFAAASVKTGASTTVTVTTAATATAGSVTIAIKGVSGTYSQSLSEGVTVVSPALRLTPGVSSVTTYQGMSATFSITVGAASGYTSPVILTAKGPTGVTVTFSPSSVKPGSSATATVSAGSTSAAGTGSITVTGTSGAATATASEGVTVNLPTLGLTPSASSVSMFQGMSSSFTVAVTASSGFTNTVSLTATAPSGMTVSFSPSSAKPGSSATATVTASGTMVAGTGSIVVKATADSATTSATVGETVVQPAVTVQTPSSGVSAFPAQAATFSVSVSASTGFTNPILLTATPPAGMTVSFSPSSVKPGSTATATVTPAASMAAGSTSLTVTGTAGTAKTSVSVPVTLNAPALSLSTGSQSVTAFPGQAAKFTVTVGAASGFTNPLTLSAKGPTGVTVTFSPSSVKPGATSTATMVAGATASIGTGSIGITGTSGIATAQATMGLTLVSPALALTPGSSSVSLYQGMSTTFTVAVSAASGYTNPVTLSAKGPTGVTVSFSPSSVIPGATAKATVTAGTTAPAGSGNIAITGTSVATTAAASEGVTVTAPTLTLTAGSLSAALYPGQTSTFSVAVSASTGFTNPVTLTATAPTGVTVSFSPSSVMPGSTATATVRAAATAATGQDTITLKGTSGAATTTVSKAVTVTSLSMSMK